MATGSDAVARRNSSRVAAVQVRRAPWRAQSHTIEWYEFSSTTRPRLVFPTCSPRIQRVCRRDAVVRDYLVG